MPRIRDFSVWIEQQNARLPEQGISIDDQQRTAFCWAPCEYNKSFSVCWKYEGKDPQSLQAWVFADGQSKRGVNKSMRTDQPSSCLSEDKSGMPFVFAALPDTFTPYTVPRFPSGTNPQPSILGSVVLDIRLGSVSSELSPTDPHRSSPLEVNSSPTDRRSMGPSSSSQFRDFVRDPNEPKLRFVFYYRASHLFNRNLQPSLSLPRTPTGPASRGHSSRDPRMYGRAMTPGPRATPAPAVAAPDRREREGCSDEEWAEVVERRHMKLEERRSNLDAERRALDERYAKLDEELVMLAPLRSTAARGIKRPLQESQGVENGASMKKARSL